MSSYEFDIGARARKVARFIGLVRSELQRAFAEERLPPRKLTQQRIAEMLETNRSVINRQLIGEENLTLRRVAELAWALDCDIEFCLKKEKASREANDRPHPPSSLAAPINVLRVPSASNVPCPAQNIPPYQVIAQ